MDNNEHFDYATYTTGGVPGDSEAELDSQYGKDLETYEALSNEQRAAAAHVLSHTLLRMWELAGDLYKQEVAESLGEDADFESFEAGAMEMMSQLHKAAETLRDPIAAFKQIIDGLLDGDN